MGLLQYRINLYMQSVATLTLSSYRWPNMVQVGQLQGCYPCLQTIRFQLPHPGIFATLSRGSQETFDELGLITETSTQPVGMCLIDPEFSLCGPGAKYRLTSLRIGPKSTGQNSDDQNWSPFTFMKSAWGHLRTGDPVAEIKYICCHLRSLQMTCVSLSVDECITLVKCTPRLEELSITVKGAVGAEGVTESSVQEGWGRLNAAIVEHCPRLKHLFLKYHRLCQPELGNLTPLNVRRLKKLDTYTLKSCLYTGLYFIAKNSLSTYVNNGWEGSSFLRRDLRNIKHIDLIFVNSAVSLPNPIAFAFILNAYFSDYPRISLRVENMFGAEYIYAGDWIRFVQESREALIRGQYEQLPGYRRILLEEDEEEEAYMDGCDVQTAAQDGAAVETKAEVPEKSAEDRSEPRVEQPLGREEGESA